MNKPATPLPWTHEQIGVSDAGPNGIDVFDIGPCDHEGAMRVRVATVAGDDATYIVAAANAYPRLMDALKKSIANHCVDDKMFCASCTPARALLRELGEL